MNTELLSAPATGRARVVSVDAYRGFVMLLMLAEVLSSCAVSAAVPASQVLALVCYEQTHAAWVGASLHDLIQPSFYFLVGIGLIFSLRRRRALGKSFWGLVGHTAFRSLVLIFLGIALISVHSRHWNWMFVDTLTQIGLAYPFLFVIALRPKRDWAIALFCILAGYWLWFALFPLPGPDFDYSAAGVPAGWVSAHPLTGFAAHWQKNSNAAGAFDRWFMNFFPQQVRFAGYENGLTTLNFIPSIATMILGLYAGDDIRGASSEPKTALARLAVTGAALLVSGLILGLFGVVPVVKAIWTPSWVLFSGGWCFLLLAMFYALIDVWGLKRAAFPLAVIGMNSIVAYALSHVYPALAFNSLKRIFGEHIFFILGAVYEPMVYGLAVLILYWLILYALYQRRIFLRV